MEPTDQPGQNSQNGQPDQEPPRPAPNPASAAHQPRVAIPVMDVVPPPRGAEAAAEPVAQPAASPAPQPQPVHAAPDDLLASELQPPAADQAEPVGQSTMPAQPANPNTKPIVITVIVVIVLAALAVFAYLKSR